MAESKITQENAAVSDTEAEVKETQELQHTVLQETGPQGREEVRLEQCSAENSVPSQQVHYHVHYHIHGDVKGDVVDARTSISDCNVGSLIASPSRNSLPGQQMANAQSTLNSEAAHTEQNFQIKNAFIGLLDKMDLSAATHQHILDAIKESDRTEKRKEKIDDEGQKKTIRATPVDIRIPPNLIQDVITNMDHITFGKNIKDLLIEAFDAFVRQEETEKSILMLITTYKEEKTSLPSSFYENHKDIKEDFIEFWERYQLNLASAAFQRHTEDTTETTRAFSRICAKLSAKLLKQNRKSIFDTFKRFIATKSQREAFSSAANDFINMGKDFVSMSKPIHAILSFFKAAELWKLAKNGDTSIRGITTCSYQTRLIVRELAKAEAKRSVVTDHVIPIMKEMENYIRSFENSSISVRVEHEAWSLLHTGLCYYYCGEWMTFAKESETGIQLLETEFKEKANEYQIYGLCLNNAGAAYGRKGEFAKAIEYVERSLKAYQYTKDWESEWDKRGAFETTRRNMRRYEKQHSKQNKK